jgi:glyoxylase-like metal-dependent hydrolase (beta-lactamase superfamily II)
MEAAVALQENGTLAAGLMAACLWTGARPAGAAESPVDRINAETARSAVTVQSLRGGVSMLSGAGGNIAVLVGPDGKFLVDTGIAVSRRKVKAALAGLGPGPLRYVVETHWHWDHTDGAGWAHDAGATIVAHPNTFTHLSQSERVPDWKHTFAPPPVSARPTEFVPTERTWTFDGRQVTAGWYGPAHTDGDLWVYFAGADVLATGDTFWNGVYPFIDNAHGGGIDGMIRAADANLARATDATLVIPGHGPVGRRTDLQAWRDMLVAVRDRVAALKKQGKTRDEVVAARPTAEFDARWGGFVIDPAFFTRLVYDGL